MRAMRVAMTVTVLLAAPLSAAAPARAQQNQLLGGVQHFFDGMTPNGSLRQAYEAGRRDEYAALQSARDHACAPQPINPRYAGGYGVGGYGPYGVH